MTTAKVKVSTDSTTPWIRTQTAPWAIVIILGAVIAYAPAVAAGWIWDDPQYVLQNLNLRTWHGLFNTWFHPQSLPQWYPVVHTALWVQYQLWGPSPLGYHLVNVLLHIVSAILLWRLLSELEFPAAWLAAAIFALHPVEAETVAWVTEQKNLWSGVFCLLAFLAYLRFDPVKATRHPDGKRAAAYLACLACFIAALLSKSVTATFPAAMLVIIWWKRGTIRLRDVVPLAPFFLLGIVAGLCTAYLEAAHVGATGSRIAELDLSVAQRILIAGRAVWFYAGKLAWPYPLAFVYPRWDINPRAGWQWLAPAGAAAALLILIAGRRRIGRGPAAAALLYCGMLFPALGFVNVYPMRFSFVADHFQYHASAALIALAAAGLCKYLGIWGRVVLVPLAVATFIRSTAFSDAETLWRDTESKNPDSWMVQTNLANALFDRAQAAHDVNVLAEADLRYLRALKLSPDIHETHWNAGNVFARRGDYATAVKEFEQTLRLNPQFTAAMIAKGRIAELQGDDISAITCYEQAIGIIPEHYEAHVRLAGIFERRENFAMAAEHYRLALTQNPDDAALRASADIADAKAASTTQPTPR